MNIMWVLTGNSSFIKIFEVKGKGKEFKEIFHFDNPDGRKKNGEINSDKPGRTFDKFGVGRHSYSKEVDPHTHELKVFAHKLASCLQEGKVKNKFHELAFVAPSHFLGELRLVISEAVKKSISQEVHKDLPEHLKEHERVAQLCEYLELWNHDSQKK